MNCKNCGFSQMQAVPVCPKCGQWAFSVPPALPAPKKRSAALPYLIILGMLLVGIVLYFLIPMGTAEEIPAEPNATVSPEGKNLFQKDCFILENGVLSFDESKFSHTPILIIPAAIEKQPVTAIASHCFEGLQGVTTVILPSTVTEIGDFAFAGCTDLRGISIPAATRTVGENAFRMCKNLEAVCIPAGLEKIGTGAFSDCPELIFLFYNGLYTDWQNLYPEEITPFTWAICWDGDYRHNGKTP